MFDNWFGNKKDEKVENNIKKEDNMAKSEFGSIKESLDYKKVQDNLNACGKRNAQENKFKSLIDVLRNFKVSFEKLTQEDKNEELKNDKFKKISSDINNLKCEEKILNEIKDIITKMQSQKELSKDEKIHEIYETVNILSETLKRLEKEDIGEQGKAIQDIGTSIDKIDKIDKSINDLKENIAKIPKEKSTLNLTPIENKISHLKETYNFKSNEIINKIDSKIASKIDKIKFPDFPKPSKIPTDYLKKDDFEFKLTNKFDELKDLKELSENLETVPAKINSMEKEIKNLSEKMDNLPSQSSSTSNSMNIPKEEKAVIELAKYMNDGVAQFENIAKEYISKIQELEKFEKTKAKHKKELEEVKNDSIHNGIKEGQISLIKDIAEKFPSSFDEIKSLFEEYITEKYKKDEEIEITNENQNDNLFYLDGEISLGKYRIITPAILLDGKVILNAKVKKIKEKEKENQDG